jgi:hypothetical protein
VLRKKEFLFLWCLLPVLTLVGYFKIIPTLSLWAGHGYAHIGQYDKAAVLNHANVLIDSFQYLAVNTKSLLLDTIGIMPFSPRASIYTKGLMVAAFMAWWVIMMRFLLKAQNKRDHLIIFLIGLILFSNYSMAITEKTWGPYYYGGYWSIFFTIYTGRQIEKAMLGKNLLVFCMFFILINMSNDFLDMNMICKKCQYHWPTSVAKQYFQYKLDRFDPGDKSIFTGEQIKSFIFSYWTARNAPRTIHTLPRELNWLAVESKPDMESLYRKRGIDFFDVF